MDDKQRNIGLRKLLGHDYLMVSKPILKLVGQDAAIWIADVFSKFNYFEKRGMLEEDGTFFNTQENIQKDTQISFYNQSMAVKKLKEMGIIDVTRKGIPPKNYYKFNFDTLTELLSTDQNICMSNDKTLDVTMFKDCPENGNNKTKDNKIKLNKYSSKEEYKHFVTQSDNLVSSVDKQSKHTLIRTGMAKPKETIIDKPLNGPYKKIFDYWQLSGLRTPKTQNKTYDKNVLALRGLLNGSLFDRKYTIDEIVKVIDLLKLAISPDYSPTSLTSKEYYRNLYFYQFVLKYPSNKSLFKELLDNPPKPLKETIKPIADPDPEITNYIKNFYVERVLGDSTVKLTATDENIFRKTTEKLYQFHNDNKDKYQTPFITVGDIARFYTNAIVDFIDKRHNSNMRNWDINFFKWGDFFNKQFPAYLFDMAIIAGKPRFQSPLNM